MKTRLFAFAAASLLSLQSFAQATQPPVITVSGSAEIKVAPDEIYLRVGVETRDENLVPAKKQNDEQIAKALAFLTSTGIPSKDVQTDFISVGPEYNYSVSTTKPITYVVRKSIELKLTKIENFERVLTGLLSNGVNNVHGIELRTSQLRKHRDAARAAAIRAAREKADALASELGVKRGKVYNINANEWGGWSNPSSYWGGQFSGMAQNSVQNANGGAEAVSDALSIGQIAVSASVNVSFVIE